MVVAELTELELNLLEIILEILELLVGDGVVNVLGRHLDDYAWRLKCEVGEKREECVMQKGDLLRRGSLLPLYTVELATQMTLIGQGEKIFSRPRRHKICGGP